MGRLHSSTITVAVMPVVPFDFTINDKDIKFEFMRASGAGGQHVNKTESACRATHIPTGLSVFNQEERVQDRNKKRAVEILKQKIFELEYTKNCE
jgi:protein subunit release factor A